MQAQEQYQHNHEGIHIIGAYARLAQALYLQGRYDEALVASQQEIAFAEARSRVERDPEDRRIQATARQMGLLAWTALAFLPLAVIAAGFGSWWRRR